MTDLLVRLYDLPPVEAHLKALDEKAIVVRRAMASEKSLVTAWVRNLFGDGWAGETDVAFARQPIACIIAASEGRMVGFACHDATCRNFFGPIGIDPVFRHQRIGQALLLSVLHDMARAGYAYAIVGGAGPMAFFEKSVGAFPIPGSTPGLYQPNLKKF